MDSLSKQDKDSPRSTCYQFRISGEEKEQWAIKANLAGESLSPLIRKLLRGERISTARDRQVNKLIYQIRRIENNLVQIERWAIVYKDEGEAEQVKIAMSRIRQQLQELKATANE